MISSETLFNVTLFDLRNRVVSNVEIQRLTNSNGLEIIQLNFVLLF